MNIERQIEFDKVKEFWKEFAVTQAAKEAIQNTYIYLDELELRKNLRDTTDSKKLIEKLGMPPLQDVTEIKEILNIADRGDCLSPYQLERVRGVLVVVERLKVYLEKGKVYENPIAYYADNFDERRELREEIARQIRNEKVDDHASKRLFEVRTEMQKCEEQMKQKAEQIMRSNKECMADSYYTIRNGRVCVPVKKEYKFKISGSVVDKSSTGSTFFIEPTSVAQYFEKIQLLRIEEDNEEYQILYTLTAMVADAALGMTENMKLIEKLDFYFSKGKLSIEWNAVEPQMNLERVIQLVDARHPLMDPKVNVPLQFQLGEEYRGIVITGPNTGGKTVSIKTVMLNCIMAQCGLHVTCKAANICMNSSYLCDIGDGQNLSENLSTFSAHIKNVLSVLSEVSKDSFVIMDELGSGTDPAEGMGIAIAILEELRKSGTNFLVTTHYPEVKDYAARTENIVNARMTFDKQTLKPTYQMVIGQAGESCAFYIADRLGMPADMLKTAVSAAYGEATVEKYQFSNQAPLQKVHKAGITKIKKSKVNMELGELFQIGDSVMVSPENKIGIVCEPVNEQGMVRVQMPEGKVWLNHKRVKLHVRAQELYPEDYDFSIIFDSVEARKARHEMNRKYTDITLKYEE